VSPSEKKVLSVGHSSKKILTIRTGDEVGGIGLMVINEEWEGVGSAGSRPDATSFASLNASERRVNINF
jgi:hypothetical protein